MRENVQLRHLTANMAAVYLSILGFLSILAQFPRTKSYLGCIRWKDMYQKAYILLAGSEVIKK
jgi:hypothetical protein